MRRANQAMGWVLALLCATASWAGNWVPVPQSSRATLLHRLEHAHWIASSTKSSARPIYVFLDPDCSYCNALWKELGAAHATEVQVRHLLVAVIDADSRGKDAAILQAHDPVGALQENERHFDQGGVKPDSPQRTTAEILAANEQLMNDLHLYGTPAVVYVDSTDNLKVFAGKPDRAQLQQILAAK